MKRFFQFSAGLILFYAVYKERKIENQLNFDFGKEDLISRNLEKDKLTEDKILNYKLSAYILSNASHRRFWGAAIKSKRL